MKKVAIVILNWNGRKLMEEFLPSVVSNSPEWAEVIVADNGSTDDSIEMLKAKFPTVGIISFNQNYGFAKDIIKRSKGSTMNMRFIKQRRRSYSQLVRCPDCHSRL